MDRSELKERNKTNRELIGKFFLDLSKLSFAGVVLVKMAYIRPEDDLITTIMAIISGGLLTAVFLMIGLLVLKL